MKIAITLITDQRGYDLARFALASILVSQKDDYDLFLYCDSFTPPIDEPLLALAREAGRSLEFRPAGDPFYDRFTAVGHISATTMKKFEAVRDLGRDYDRILYADIDILFFESLPLAEISFDGRPVGAAFDIAETAGLTDPGFADNCRRHGVSPDYFNAGLIYFDAQACDVPELEAAYRRFTAEHDAACWYKSDCGTSDQCSFNRLFEHRWKSLPIGWNTQACARFTPEWRKAAVRHYTGPKKFLPVRPWRNDWRDTRYLGRLARALKASGPKTLALTPLVFGFNAWKRRREAAVVRRAMIRLRLQTFET